MTSQKTLRREIISVPVYVEYGTTEDPIALLQEKAQSTRADERGILLAHSYEGVLWGLAQHGHLHFAPSIATFHPVSLHARTLQQARFFLATAEWHLWRIDEKSFRWRQVVETEATDDKGEIEAHYSDCIEEQYLLWGTHIEGHSSGFVLLRHGAEGLRHALPTDLTAGLGGGDAIAAPCLRILHYLTRETFARTAFSRFTALLPLEKPK